MMIALTATFLSSSPLPHRPFRLHHHSHRRTPSFPRPTLPFPAPLRHRPDRRRSLVVTNAGSPSVASLALVFFLPLSLLIFTILTSIRIADKLDEDYLEEVALYEDMDDDEEDGFDEEEVDEGEFGFPTEPEPMPRVRNRPKREAS